jgi:DNA-binding CsgD family transcriptional regulator
VAHQRGLGPDHAGTRGGQPVIQTHATRVEALKSVLPLLELHLDLICRVRSALGGAWESEPSPLDSVPKPKLFTPDMTCAIRCLICRDTLHCRDEAWVLREIMLRSAYHLGEITDSLERLAGFAPWGRYYASAVYWEHVEPWTSWNPAKRREWSEYGLDFMAENITVDLEPFRMGNRQTGKLSRNEEIVRLREAGLSYHQISKTLRCSKSTVSALLSGRKVRSGRVVSADGA